MRRTILASLLLAAAPLAGAADGAAARAGADAHSPCRDRSGGRAQERAKPCLDIYGFAMLDMGYDSGRTTRTGSTSCGRPSCRPTRTSSARTATTSPASGRAGSASRRSSRPTLGELKTHLRVRAVRHRRRRRPDDVPAAPRLRRARAVRRRPDLEPVHGPRRVPELGRVLGPERHGVLPQRPAALDADPGRHPA